MEPGSLAGRSLEIAEPGAGAREIVLLVISTAPDSEAVAALASVKISRLIECPREVAPTMAVG
jgi:hypothetical protein